LWDDRGIGCSHCSGIVNLTTLDFTVRPPVMFFDTILRPSGTHIIHPSACQSVRPITPMLLPAILTRKQKKSILKMPTLGWTLSIAEETGVPCFSFHFVSFHFISLQTSNTVSIFFFGSMGQRSRSLASRQKQKTTGTADHGTTHSTVGSGALAAPVLTAN